MTTEIIATQSTISWTRIKSVLRFYMPILKLQLIIYPAIAIVMFALGVYANYIGGPVAVMLSMSIMSSILGFMIYFAPCVLTRRNTRITELMLPASSVEKAGVLIVYFLIFLPAITTGLFQLLNYIGTEFFSLPCMLDLTSEMAGSKAALPDFLKQHTFIAYLASMSQTAAYITTCLWCVLAYRNNRTLMSIVWCVVVMITIGLISGIYTAVSVISHHASGFVNGNVDDTAINDTVTDSISMLMPTISAICIIYCIFGIWMIWRQFSKRQI